MNWISYVQKTSQNKLTVQIKLVLTSDTLIRFMKYLWYLLIFLVIIRLKQYVSLWLVISNQSVFLRSLKIQLVFNFVLASLILCTIGSGLIAMFKPIFRLMLNATSNNWIRYSNKYRESIYLKLAVTLLLLFGLQLGETTVEKAILSFNHSTIDLTDKTKFNKYNLVFYKPNCNLCNSGSLMIASSINDKRQFNNSFPIYFVNVETEFGQELVHKYDIVKSNTMVSVSGNDIHKIIYSERTKVNDEVRLSDQFADEMNLQK